MSVSAKNIDRGDIVGARQHRHGRWAIYLFLIIVCLVQLVPFWLAICQSTKPSSDMSSTLVPRLTNIQWSNFTQAVTEGGILRAILNSVIITLGATVLTCVIGAMAAYPLARRPTRGNKFVSSFILALMMIPPLSILVPLYTFLVRIGGVNSYWGPILVLATSNLPLAIFLYTAFIRSIPSSIDEAGMMDGAGPMRIFFTLILPLLKPVTATVVIMTGVGVWNEYALSSYLLTDQSMQTIAPRVASFFAAQSSNLGVGAAAALMAALPIIIAYMFLQRYFIAGMVAGAEK
jgi:raffinose/stachyose/melibiose transport system permease protein